MDLLREYISVLETLCRHITGGFEEEGEDVTAAVPTQGVLISVLVLGRETISCARKEHTQKD